MEPWQKVFIKLPRSGNIEDRDGHFKVLSCVDCHGGDANQPNSKEKAHQNLVVDPSEYVMVNGTMQNKCGDSGCHSGKSEGFKTSLHQQLWGFKKMIAIRSDVTSFDQCPESTREGFDGDCTSCHTTCGQCHVAIPNSAGSGLVNNHEFRGTPDQANNCLACHGSRIAHDFLGDENTGRPGDVHYQKFMKCWDCHSGTEMHSAVSDTNNTDRYTYEELPECYDCHPESEIGSKNAYHSVHMDDMTCYVCHSQPYNNCTGCHVNNAWQTDPVYQARNPEEDFKIGLNPLTTHNPAKFALLRHVPVVKDTYANWGAGSANLPGYDNLPTWKFTSPHNIQRWTPLTEASPCYNGCHTKDGFGNPENKKYFLFKDYLQNNAENPDWTEEVNANEPVFVDGQLPSGWE